MSKHTPGPWQITARNDSVEGDATLIRSQYQDIAIMHGPPCGSSLETANADLIAAAPEMLEALELALKVGVARLCSSEEIDQIERAIAKARGE